MQIHQVKSKTKKNNKKRIGRGGKRGVYSGKGLKGQKSRAGRRMRPQLRDIIKKIPKKRGYRFKAFKKKPSVINLSVLEKNFSGNEKVTPQILFDKGLIKREGGFLPKVKLLASGKITKPLLVSECQISGAAQKIIESAGGKVAKHGA